MKQVTLSEDVRVPGTDFLLEKGDTVRLVEGMFPSNVDTAIDRWLDKVAPDDSIAAGQYLATAVIYYLEESNPEFQQAFYSRIKRAM